MFPQNLSERHGAHAASDLVRILLSRNDLVRSRLMAPNTSIAQVTENLPSSSEALNSISLTHPFQRESFWMAEQRSQWDLVWIQETHFKLCIHTGLIWRGMGRYFKPVVTRRKHEYTYVYQTKQMSPNTISRNQEGHYVMFSVPLENIFNHPFISGINPTWSQSTTIELELLVFCWEFFHLCSSVLLVYSFLVWVWFKVVLTSCVLFNFYKHLRGLILFFGMFGGIYPWSHLILAFYFGGEFCSLI
jgi:hypothetical protein